MRNLEGLPGHSVNLTCESASPSAAGCRFCGQPLNFQLVDLGMSPLCESYLRADQLNQVEPFYPLRVTICQHCFLAQLEAYVSAESIFSEYAYFSSYSDSWVAHARQYVQAITSRLSLGSSSLVVEVASNDGYLLQHFVPLGVPVLGVEPAANVAAAAEAKSIPTRVAFFGRQTAAQLAADGIAADLLVANNVLAQVPDLHDFVAGIPILLKPAGIATLEFPHFLKLIIENQFDSIYHEHFSYFSLRAVERIFLAHGMRIFDVETLATHGGSLRVYVCRVDNTACAVSTQVEQLRAAEDAAGLERLETYADFAPRVQAAKWDLLEFLIQARRQGKRVVGYGAPGKGNTLLNYCGIRTDLLDFTVDRNPYKQGKFLPGTHIPIHAPDRLRAAQPDVVLILPWNLQQEIMQQLQFIRAWGGQFAIPIPSLQVV